MKTCCYDRQWSRTCTVGSNTLLVLCYLPIDQFSNFSAARIALAMDPPGNLIRYGTGRDGDRARRPVVLVASPGQQQRSTMKYLICVPLAARRYYLIHGIQIC